jgi:hypothetical protein
MAPAQFNSLGDAFASFDARPAKALAQNNATGQWALVNGAMARFNAGHSA